MRKYEFSDHLKKLLTKFYKKDNARYEAILKKVKEILTCKDVDHYKNLKKPLKHLKRVHVEKSFVLTFRYDKTEDVVYFYDFDHHDYIYGKQ